MSILIIFTGGTIGSSLSENTVLLDDKAKHRLIDGYISRHGDNVEFVTAIPFETGSENLSAEYLNLLTSCINENLGKNYDGIIVTHGTDTLQYSSAALDLMFGNAEIPILLVSANYPLDDCRSNGNDNFDAAVSFILGRHGKGVFVSYRNTNETCTSIHYAFGLFRHREYDDGIYNISPPYASVSGDSVTVNRTVSDTRICPGAASFSDESEICVIDACPGYLYPLLTNSTKAVLIFPYHSATLGTSDKGLKDFCAAAKKCGIPVFVTDCFPRHIYESSSEYERLGIIPLKMTFAEAYMRIWYANSKENSPCTYLSIAK